MNCCEARKYLSAFMDNELDVRTNIEILEHIEMCDSCARRLEEHRQLKVLVMASIASTMAPTGLRGRIAERLATARPGRFLLLESWREVVGASWFRAVAAAASIIVVFGLVYGVLLAQPTPVNAGAARAHWAWLSDQVPNFVVTNNAIRARKYAFLRFARKPSVGFLENSQFELVGAGPAEIASMNVGRFVFRYKAVTVSMFIFDGLALEDIAGTEKQNGRDIVKVDSRGGMNLVAWRNGDFAYVLVSALPQSDLMHIVGPGQVPE